MKKSTTVKLIKQKIIPQESSLFLWYDSFYKKMNKFSCSHLQYNFVKQKYCEMQDKNIPLQQVVDEMFRKSAFLYSKQYCRDYLIKQGYVKQKIRYIGVPVYNKEKKEIDIVDKIKKYFNYSQFEGQIQSNNKNFIQVSIQEKGLQELLDYLKRNRIKYEI